MTTVTVTLPDDEGPMREMCRYRPGNTRPSQFWDMCGIFADFRVSDPARTVFVCETHLARACRSALDDEKEQP